MPTYFRSAQFLGLVACMALGGCATTTEDPDPWGDHAVKLSDLPKLREQAFREIEVLRQSMLKDYPPSHRAQDCYVSSSTPTRGPVLFIWSFRALKGSGPIYVATFPKDGGSPEINTIAYGSTIFGPTPPTVPIPAKAARSLSPSSH